MKVLVSGDAIYAWRQCIFIAFRHEVSFRDKESCVNAGLMILGPDRHGCTFCEVSTTQHSHIRAANEVMLRGMNVHHHEVYGLNLSYVRYHHIREILLKVLVAFNPTDGIRNVIFKEKLFQLVKNFHSIKR
ncbi:hypothetical protein ACREYP_07755 [Enterobacter sp. TMH.L2]